MGTIPLWMLTVVGDSMDLSAAPLFKPGDIVWAKLRGYPFWPARVTQPDASPLLLHARKPKGESYPVLFFASKDYSWISKDQLRPFEQHLEEFRSKNHSSQFKRAVKEAIDPSVVFESDDEEEELADEEEMPKKIPKKRGRKPKNLEKQIEEKPKSVKRKKEEEKPKQDQTTEDKVRGFRNKLQKICYESPFKVEEFGKADEVLRELESTNITIDILKSTKIGKLIKLIGRGRDGFPENDPYNIVARCSELTKKWRLFLIADENNSQ